MCYKKKNKRLNFPLDLKMWMSNTVQQMLSKDESWQVYITLLYYDFSVGSNCTNTGA